MSKCSASATRIQRPTRRCAKSLSEPRKQPVQQRARVTVEAILDATAHIWAREGYAAVNTNRVAEAAGVSIGSLYQCFPDKAALVGAVAVRHSEAMARARPAMAACVIWCGA